jgi:hypothetical protein
MRWLNGLTSVVLANILTLVFLILDPVISLNVDMDFLIC